MNPIRIRRAALDTMAAHARDEAPNECCGLLIGAADVVEEAVRARNARRSPTQYLIDPQDQFAAVRAARQSAREVMGAYHSHPGGDPVPSPTDLAEAHYPEYVYVIVRPAASGRPADIRAYRLFSGNFEPVELVTLP